LTEIARFSKATSISGLLQSAGAAASAFPEYTKIVAERLQLSDHNPLVVVMLWIDEAIVFAGRQD